MTAPKNTLERRVVQTSDLCLFGIVRPTGNASDEYRWVLKRRQDPKGPNRFDPPAIVDTGVRKGTMDAFRDLYQAIAYQGELAV